jgi:hypothetical protein
MLAGEMEKIDLEVKRLTGRRAAIAEKHGALAKVAALAEVPQLPDVVPPVRAHHPVDAHLELTQGAHLNLTHP